MHDNIGKEQAAADQRNTFDKGRRERAPYVVMEGTRAFTKLLATRAIPGETNVLDMVDRKSVV